MLDSLGLSICVAYGTSPPLCTQKYAIRWRGRIRFVGQPSCPLGCFPFPFSVFFPPPPLKSTNYFRFSPPPFNFKVTQPKSDALFSHGRWAREVSPPKPGRLFGGPWWGPCSTRRPPRWAPRHAKLGVWRILRGQKQKGVATATKHRLSLSAFRTGEYLGVGAIWVWVKIKPPGIGPQVDSSMCPFAGASHFGYFFLTHSQIISLKEKLLSRSAPINPRLTSYQQEEPSK